MMVKVQNFACLSDIEFIIEQGLTLVYGENGAGKSSLFEAMPWALWGYYPKKTKREKTGFMKDGAKSCSVSLRDNGLEIEREIFKKRDHKVIPDFKNVYNFSPLSYDLYRQVVHVNFGLPFSLMTLGEKGGLIGELLCEETLENCKIGLMEVLNTLTFNLQDIQRKMEGINGEIRTLRELSPVVKDFILEKEKESYIKIREDLNKLDNICLSLKTDRHLKEKMIRVLDGDTCIACGQTITKEYRDKFYDSLKIELASLIKDINLYTTEITELTSKMYSSKEQLSKYEAYMFLKSSIENKVRNLDSLNTELIGLEKQIDSNRKWYDFFSGARGLKAILISWCTEYISQLLQRYEELLGLSESFIRWEGNRFSPYSFNRPYEDLSKGERRRLDILLCLALRELVKSMKGLGFCDYLVLDEVFDGLDDKGITEVIGLFRNLSLKRVIIISPRYIEGDWNQIFQVSKGKVEIQCKL